MDKDKWMNGGQVTLTLVGDAPGIGANGQKVTLALTPSDVHVPEELDTFLAGYHNAQYRADEASKPVPVEKDQDFYRIFNRNNVFKKTPVKASMTQAVPEITPESSTTKYQVVDRLLGTFVPDVTADQSMSLYDVKMVSAEMVKNAIMLDREVDVWAMLTTLANWNAANRTTLGATAKWNGGVDADPIRDLKARIITSAAPPNGIWLNQDGALEFLLNPSVREHMRSVIGDRGYDSIGGAVQAAESDSVDFKIPGLPPFHVVASKVLNETTGNLDFALGNHCVLTVTPPGVPRSGYEIATTHTFRRKGRSGTGWQTREFRVEGRGAGGVMVVVNMADIAVITGNDCGGLIRDIIQ